MSSERILSMDCTSFMLDFMSEVDVWKYGQEIVSSKEAVDSYWKRKRVIIIDKILPAEAHILLRVLELCPNLTELTLECPDDLKLFKELPAIIANTCANMVTLKLKGLILHKESVLKLCKCTKIRSLDIRTVVRDDVLTTLFSCMPELEKVSLIDEITLLRGDCLLALPRILKRLVISRTFELKSYKLAQALDAFDNLEVLDILGLDGHHFFPKLSPSLIVLSVHGTDFSNLNTITHCKLLRKLSVFDNGMNIDNALISALVENCVLIENLSLSLMYNSVTAEGFGQFGKLPNLRELSISGEIVISSDDTTHTVCLSNLSTCKALQKLSVRSCALTNFAALEIIENCSKLCYFAIAECQISSDLPALSIDALEKQTNRKSALKMELFMYKPKNLQEHLYIPVHPLLTVTYIDPKTWRYFPTRR